MGGVLGCVPSSSSFGTSESGKTKGSAKQRHDPPTVVKRVEMEPLRPLSCWHTSVPFVTSNASCLRRKRSGEGRASAGPARRQSFTPERGKRPKSAGVPTTGGSRLRLCGPSKGPQKNKNSGLFNEKELSTAKRQVAMSTAMSSICPGANA